MIVVEDYRHHRIEVNAVAAGDRFNAEVKIRRTLSDAKTHIEIVSCLKVGAHLAERAGELWARRWIDLQLTGGWGSN